MKALKVIAALAVAATLTSCSCISPLTATSNTVGTKCGQSHAVTILGVLCFGQDASIDTAAKKAGITKISHIDQKNYNVLGIYNKTTTIVYGE